MVKINFTELLSIYLNNVSTLKQIDFQWIYPIAALLINT